MWTSFDNIYILRSPEPQRRAVIRFPVRESGERRGGTVTSQTVTSICVAESWAEPVFFCRHPGAGPDGIQPAVSGAAVERSTVRTVLRAVGIAAGQLAVSVRTARAARRTSDFGPFYAQ